MRNIWKSLLYVALVALVLHGIWEYIQCGIFYTMPGTWADQIKVMISATLGDMNIAIGLFLLLVWVNNDSSWLTKDWDRKDVLVMILYSLFVSFYFEINALHEGRWGYSTQMPLFPTTNIGLLPVIQLLILLPLGFLIAKWLAKKLD